MDWIALRAHTRREYPPVETLVPCFFPLELLTRLSELGASAKLKHSANLGSVSIWGSSDRGVAGVSPAVEWVAASGHGFCETNLLTFLVPGCPGLSPPVPRFVQDEAIFCLFYRTNPVLACRRLTSHVRSRPRLTQVVAGCRYLSFSGRRSPYLYSTRAWAERQSRRVAKRDSSPSTARRRVSASPGRVFVGTTPIGDTPCVASASPVGRRSPTVPPGRTEGLLALAMTSRPCRLEENSVGRVARSGDCHQVVDPRAGPLHRRLASQQPDPPDADAARRLRPRRRGVRQHAGAPADADRHWPAPAPRSAERGRRPWTPGLLPDWKAT
jgi:hypothetical protein